jgi:GNAT superfamily N-acetyltransferase
VIQGTRRFTLRPAADSDAAELARLCEQLGYPATTQEIASRLSVIAAKENGCVIAAEDESGCVVGWIGALLVHSLESPPFAEISGLVVDQEFRGRGIGAALIEAAERWTIARDVPVLRVRSNVIRESAHSFYEKRGYARLKTQYVFEKQVARS